jgi:HK97 family phage prohead protease
MELHQKKLNLNISTKQFNITDEQDVVTIEGYASKMYQDGNPVTDLDQEMVSTANFRLDAKRLLLNHELDEVVGQISLEHRPDGIYLKGKGYKDTMKDQDWARLKRGLFDFSIGFIAEEAEYKNIDGKEILVFTKGVIYEVSLVAIPSNKFATLDVIKSIQSKSGLVMECSIDNIKSMNPDMDCSCLNGLKEEAKQKQIKGEEMQRENIEKDIEVEVTKEVATENTEVVAEDKPVEETKVESVQEVIPEVKETVETKVEATPTETPKEETKEEVKTEVTEQSQEQNISTEVKTEVSSDDKNNDEKSETNELANTLDFKQETIDILTADLEQLDVDKIRVLYDTLADKLEKVGALQAIQALQKIEQYVENELQNQE